MDEVFKKARELGGALMASDEYVKMKQAEAIAMKNEDAASTMGRYLELKGQVESMMGGHNEDWTKLKRLSDDMEACQQKLGMIDDVINMNAAREAFSRLVNQVNSVLRFMMTGSMQSSDDETGCSGSCERCAGCRTIH